MGFAASNKFPRIWPLVAVLSALLSATQGADANIITYDISYSGLAPSTAIATGFVSFDTTILPNTAHVDLTNVSPATLGIVAWSLTVSGAAIGNGTFTLADFSADPNGWVWQLDSPLDLSKNLVGQLGFADFNWCASSHSCGSSTAPGGVATFEIGTAGETGDALLLRSMAPDISTTIPEPFPLSIVGLGAAGLVTLRRRKARPH